MLRVTRNVAVDQLRRQRPIPVEEVRDRDAIASLGGPEQIDELAEALSTLPLAQREVLRAAPSRRAHAGWRSQTARARPKARSHGLHHRGRRALIEELRTRGRPLSPLVPLPQAQRISNEPLSP